MSRWSTARTPPTDLVDHLFVQLPGRRVLNLGSGHTARSEEDRLIVNLDHVSPERQLDGAFVLADVSLLPFRAAVFDSVLLKDVLEHMTSPIDVLREARRVATERGFLLLTTPRAIPRAVWDDPTHIRGFTAHALTEALRMGGWRATGPPRRIGSLPGATRLRLTTRLELVMRIPILGHWFGTNHLVRAEALPRGELA